MALVVRPGLRFDRNRNPGRGDRHRVNVSRTPPGQRVPQPPAVCLQRRERTMHLVLRASTDAATTGECEPVPSVEAEPERDDEQQPLERPRSRAPDHQREQHRGGAPRGRPARAQQTPVLLSTRVIQPTSSPAGGSADGSAGRALNRRSASSAAAASHPGCFPAAATSPGASHREPWSLASSRAAAAASEPFPPAIDSQHAASATVGARPRRGPSPSRRLPGLSDSRPPYQPSAITRSARRLKRRRKSGIAIRRDDATPRCSHPAWTNPAAIPGRRSSSGRDSPLRTQYLAPIASSETPTMYTPRRRSASNPSDAAEPAAVGHRASKWTCAVLPPEDRRHWFVSSSDT